jgi:hypothetical protein
MFQCKFGILRYSITGNLIFPVIELQLLLVDQIEFGSNTRLLVKRRNENAQKTPTTCHGSMTG